MIDTGDVILALQARERELERDAAAIAARLEEVRDTIQTLQRPQRTRRRVVGITTFPPDGPPDTAA